MPERTSLLPRLLTNNQLKILALIAMTADHVGLQLLPQYGILRIIGRLAFPIFAYMIAEGCTYTRNRKKYLLTLAVMAVLFQLVYFFAMDSLYQGIFVTFTLSVCLIFTIDRARTQKTPLAVLTAVGTILAVLFLILAMPALLPGTDYEVDYGLWGTLLPVAVYFVPNRMWKLAATGLMLIPLAMENGGNQWYALLTLIPLGCYSGLRGKYRMKNLFYIYYPAHLVVIWLLDMLL